MQFYGPQSTPNSPRKPMEIGSLMHTKFKSGVRLEPLSPTSMEDKISMGTEEAYNSGSPRFAETKQTTVPQQYRTKKAPKIKAAERSSSHPKNQPTDARIERYRLGEIVGKGGFGVIRKGTHVKRKGQYAIKIIQKNQIPDRIRNLCLHEGQALSLLNHQNIVYLHEFIETDTNIILVMEYVEGGDLLDDIMQRRKKREHYSEREVACIFAQMIIAIEYCHSKNIVHCDVKPENIFLDEEGDIRLGDFGLALCIEEGLQKTPLIGTINYAAPEVILGRKLNAEQLKKVDVWGLGVLLYVLTSLRYPFYASEKDQLKRNILGEQSVMYPEGMPRVIKNLLVRMLNRNIDERISLEEVMKDEWIRDQLKLCRAMTRIKEKKLQAKRDTSPGVPRRATSICPTLSEYERAKHCVSAPVSRVASTGEAGNDVLTEELAATAFEEEDAMQHSYSSQSHSSSDSMPVSPNVLSPRSDLEYIPSK